MEQSETRRAAYRVPAADPSIVMADRRCFSRTISASARLLPSRMFKLLVRLITVALFIVFFAFALKNTDEVVLRLFWGAEAKAPLILLVLGFLLVGVASGGLARTGTLLRYRRDLARARSELDQHRKAAADSAAAREQPPAPDTLIEQVGL